jgi:hypothetical protein
MITIAYPATSPTVSVSLNGPNFGDVWREAQAYLHSQNLAGEVLLNQTSKPKIKTLEYTFHAMTATSRDTLLNLIKLAIGQKVLVTDYLSNQFSCYISNSDTEIITLGDTCNYDVRVQFLVSVT